MAIPVLISLPSDPNGNQLSVKGLDRHLLISIVLSENHYRWCLPFEHCFIELPINWLVWKAPDLKTNAIDFWEAVCLQRKSIIWEHSTQVWYLFTFHLIIRFETELEVIFVVDLLFSVNMPSVWSKVLMPEWSLPYNCYEIGI